MKDAAERVLESAPHMRAVHSKESVQRLIEHAREKGDLIGTMRRDVPSLPVIVESADVQNRSNKRVDPSQLPYLYRSPCI
jgi:hypothetical protein